MDVTTYEFIATTYTTNNEASRELGHKHYEISNHLGNVLSVISDQKRLVVEDSLVVSHAAVVLTATDYSPFGVGLYGRSWSEGYRFGFNGMEVENKEQGIHFTFYRSYNASLAMWFSIDPKVTTFSHVSPYAPMLLSPVLNSDTNGDSPESSTESFGDPSSDKVKTGVSPRDLKFKYKLLRLLRPDWYGKKGFDRMIDHLTTCDNSFHDLIRKEPKKSMIVTVKTTYNVDDDEVVGSASQPWVLNRTSLQTYNLDGNQVYYLSYDMDRVRDQITIQNQAGSAIGGTPINPSGTGTINIPPGTTSITVTIVPGIRRPTIYSYQLYRRSGSVVEKKKYMLWGILRIRVEKQDLAYNRNRDYSNCQGENTTLWGMRQKHKIKSSPED